ncbi:MAG: M24 family metallopeptidase, partial [Eubacteriales bacterium]
RGGGTHDRFADIFYFTNYYPTYPYLPDYPGGWSGRSHAALIVSRTGQLKLLITSPEYRQDLITLEEVHFTTNFPESIVQSLQNFELTEGPVGVAGLDVLPSSYYLNSIAKLSSVNWVRLDEPLQKRRLVKERGELLNLEEACRIGRRAIELILAAAVPGGTEAEACAAGISYLVSQGAILYYIATSSGEHSDFYSYDPIAGYDSKKILQEGNLFRLDLVLTYNGYMCDCARTIVVGNKPTKEQGKLIAAVRDACYHLIKKIRPGVSVSELVREADSYLLTKDIQPMPSGDSPVDVDKIYSSYPSHWGHGFGLTWEKPWLIAEEKTVLASGMVLAIEKALCTPGIGYASFEENLVVTEDGCTVLT